MAAETLHVKPRTGKVGDMPNWDPLSLAPPSCHQVGGEKDKRPGPVAREGGLGPTLEPSRT